MNSLCENPDALRALDLHFVGVGGFAVRKVSVYLMLLVLSASGREAAALDLFESQTLGELPPQMSMPSDMLSSGAPIMELPDEAIIDAPAQEPLSLPAPTGELKPENAGNVQTREFHLFDCEPALLESSGTWLRRGFWYAEADAVMFNRRWDKDGTLLIQTGPTNQSPVFFPHEIMGIDGGRPGAEGVPRLKVGRFLFRDQTNRDHNLEFVAFGGGNWSQEGVIEGDSLFVPLQRKGTNEAFDGATRSQFRYDSWFESFELNYHVKQRMLKDRMELEPNGQWVRRAQPSRSLSYLAGLRYFNLDEHVDWQAFGIPDFDDDGDDEEGTYDIKTANHMFGTQLGLSQTFETARWSLGAYLKGGMYLNVIHLESEFEITDTADGLTDLEGDILSWIGEASFIGKYHITPNFSLRAGLEILHMTALALAPEQIDFNPSGSPYIGMGKDNLYLGGSIGFESYW
jgi:hypothetical protein